MNRLLSAALIICITSCTQQTKTVNTKTNIVASPDSAKGSLQDSAKNSYATSMNAHADDSIVPGKSIGHIFIGEKTEEVTKVLGEPDSSDAAMGKATLSWYSKPSKKTADTVVNSIKVFATTNFGAQDEASRVKQIRITSVFFKTPEQVGCGSTIAFIKMQYPLIKKASASYTDHSGNEVMIYDDTKEGISFEIGSNTKCVGLTVYKPGERPREIYVSEFGDLDDL
jgi:hypothetical protein